MAFTFKDRMFAVSVAIIGLGIFSFGIQPAQAATLVWAGSAGATWDITTNNWSGTPSSGTAWDVSNGPSPYQANFNASNASANATGNNLYVYAVDFLAGVSGCTISGGTINTNANSYNNSAGVIEMNLATTAGTNTISSAIVLARRRACRVYYDREYGRGLHPDAEFDRFDHQHRHGMHECRRQYAQQQQRLGGCAGRLGRFIQLAF